MAFDWFDKSIIDRFEKRRFRASINVDHDDDSKTFGVSLSWVDRHDRSGDTAIPVEAVRFAYSKILEFEAKGFKEDIPDQIYPP